MSDQVPLERYAQAPGSTAGTAATADAVSWLPHAITWGRDAKALRSVTAAVRGASAVPGSIKSGKRSSRRPIASIRRLDQRLVRASGGDG